MKITDFLRNELPSKDILLKLGRIAEFNNFEIYVVGGYVRDLILDRTGKEIDFTVKIDIEKLAEILKTELGSSEIVVYKNFGTAMIYYDNWKLEFVSARKESYSEFTRNPVVSTGNFEDDIARRDFTINTIAFSIKEQNFGEITDIYNGIQDIKDKIIRTPLDPLQTFSDDPLRIMRAIRFASQLGFRIDEPVFKAISEIKDRLSIISNERINDEFFKILMSPRPSVGLILMYSSGILGNLYPEISVLEGVEQRKDFHHKDVLFHTFQVVDNISLMSDNLWLRMAALFHDIAKPQTKKFDEEIGWTFHGHDDLGSRMIPKLFKKYKFPLNHTNYVSTLVKLHLRPIALVDSVVTDSAIRRLIVQAGDYLDDLILLCRADITSKNQLKVKKYLANYDLVVNKIIEVLERDKLRNFQSPVRGEEIMELFGLNPSKPVGIIKKKLEEEILEGNLPNDYQIVKEYLIKNYELFKELIKDYSNKT